MLINDKTIHQQKNTKLIGYIFTRIPYCIKILSDKLYKVFQG